MSQPTTYDTAQLVSEVIRESGRDAAGIAEFAQKLNAPLTVLTKGDTVLSGRIVRVNEAGEQLFGSAQDELQGMRLAQLGADISDDALETLSEKIEQTGYAVMTCTVTRKDGEVLRVERTVFISAGSQEIGIEGDAVIVVDRALESIIPPAGGADLSQSQNIALQMETLLRRYIRENYRQGMHPAQWSALRYFKLAPPEARSLTGFAKAHHTTMGTASTTVSTLVGKGYLQKHSFRGAVNLTKEGEALLRDDPLGRVVTSLNRMSAFERDWADFVLTALTDSFGAAEEK